MPSQVRREPIGDTIASLAYRVRELEAKYGMSSEAMLDVAARNPLSVDREVSEWLTSYQVLSDLRARCGVSGFRTKSTA